MRNVTRKFAVALGVVMTSATVASAQTFTGTTLGCFFGSFNGTATCTPGAGPTVIDGLSFTGSSFSEPGLEGSASFNTPTANFGNFTLSAASNTSFAGNGFMLQINVTSPATAAGMQSATLVGAVSTTPAPGGSTNLFIDFGNNNFFTFSPASAGILGQVNDLAVTIGTTNLVNGRLATVPEPSTYMLLATGMGALGLVARRRRNKA